MENYSDIRRPVNTSAGQLATQSAEEEGQRKVLATKPPPGTRITMTKTCKNCAHYSGPEDPFYEKYDRGNCDCPKFIYGGDGESKVLDDKLEYTDYECYSASFYVGGNFGCIHFKKKIDGA